MTVPAIYYKLRDQFNQYSVGYPATASGVELKILRRLFTEKEADLYLQMSMMLETPDAVAGRLSRDKDETAALLEQMAGKGLLFRKRNHDRVQYAAVAFVIGSFEFQLKSMDREFAEMTDAYLAEGLLDFTPGKNIPPLRTIPVHQSLQVNHQVAPYAQAREIIQSKKVIALADCICRVQQQMLDKGCDKPREVCLSFGTHAHYYVENKMGRYITQEEALAVLDASEKAGLVNQPANMINPGGMCNCCGDCCGVLRSLNKLPNPARAVFNDYRAQVDAGACVGCETCLTRCQINALTMNDAPVAVVDPDRCIGCGLCVSTCPSGAIEMVLKPEQERVPPPDSGRTLMARTAELRGTTLIPLSMAKQA